MGNCMGLWKKLFKKKTDVTRLLPDCDKCLQAFLKSLHFFLFLLTASDNALQFLDYSTLVIKLRDIGFGSIHPPTFRVWEQIVQLGRGQA